MKILFVVKMLAMPGGGAEKVLAEVSGRLVARGHEVTVASFDISQARDFYVFDSRVKRLRLGLGRSERPSGVIATARRAAGLRRLLRELTPDVAIGFMHSAYVPLALALLGCSVPGIASEHIVYGHYHDRPVERVLLRLAAPLFRSITAVSQEMRQSFPPAIRGRMVVIPNPVAAAGGVVTGATDASRAGSAARTLLTVGRLEPQKDQKTLVNAFARVSDSFPEWKLRIVGEGALRPVLERQVAALGLVGRVTLPGATAEIDAEYRGADLFVLPSRYESFGIATAEALSHGLAAVGFADCSGTNELIAHEENGLLVAGADRVAALAAGLARLMASDVERVRMGEAGPARLAPFAPDNVVDQWEALLKAPKVRS